MPSLFEVQQEIKEYFVNGGLDIKDLDKELKSKNLIFPKQTYEQLSIYKSLVLDSISDLVRNIYPLTFSILKSKFIEDLETNITDSKEIENRWLNEWNLLISSYLANYPSESPIFNEAAKDFPEFLKAKHYKPEYVFELAFYEWSMLALFLHEDLPRESKVTSVHLLCNFSFPILEIAKEIEEENYILNIEKKEQKILIYRDEKSKKVRTMVLSPLTFFVIAGLIDNMNKGKICEAIKNNFAINSDQISRLDNELEVLFRDLQENNILV